MKDKPLVSVIIIFLNAQQFIKEAIESVLAQTYDNWELLLVDDGSTDGSTDTALEYTVRYPHRIQYLEHRNHENRGMSVSRNLGILKATGKYFALLDADDVWLPHKLEHQIAILESHPETAMVYGPVQYWYSWTGKPADVGRDFMQDLIVKADTLYKPLELFATFLENEVAVPCIGSFLVRRHVTERVGGFVEAFRGLYEDQVFFTKVCLQAPIFVSSECTLKYRRHPTAACVVVKGKKQIIYTARLAFLRWLKTHLTRENIRDRDVWRTLQKALQAEELQPYCHPFRYRLLSYSRRFSNHVLELLRGILPKRAKRFMRRIVNAVKSLKARIRITVE